MNQPPTMRVYLLLGIGLLISAAFLMWSGFNSHQDTSIVRNHNLMLNEIDQDIFPCGKYDSSTLCDEKEERSIKCVVATSENEVSKTKIKIEQTYADGSQLKENSSKLLPMNASLNVMIEQFRVNKRYKDGSPFYLITYDAFHPFVEGSFQGLSPEAYFDSCGKIELTVKQIDWLKQEGSKKIIAQARRQNLVN